MALQGSVQFLEIKRGGKGEQLETLCAAYCQPQTCCEWTGGWNHDPATLLFKTWLPKCPACQRIHPHSGHVAKGLTAQYQAPQSPLVSQAHPSHPEAVSSSSSRPFCWERPVHSACSTTQDNKHWLTLEVPMLGHRKKIKEGLTACEGGVVGGVHRETILPSWHGRAREVAGICTKLICSSLATLSWHGTLPRLPSCRGSRGHPQPEAWLRYRTRLEFKGIP